MPYDAERGLRDLSPKELACFVNASVLAKRGTNVARFGRIYGA